MTQRGVKGAQRLLLIGVALLLTSGLAGQVEPEALVLTGTVSIERSESESTRVSVTEQGHKTAAHSFVIQHQASFPVQTGNGPGRVIFKKNLLVVSLGDETGWVAALDSHNLAPGSLPASASSYPIYDISGLAHYWPSATRPT